VWSETLDLADLPVQGKSLPRRQSELLEFKQYVSSNKSFPEGVHIWINGLIPSRTQSQILEDWDNFGMI
jgi:hypothetical protein